jgi:hypothetical protein
MNEKNRTATDEYIKKHAKIIGQQIRVLNSIQEAVKFFAPKSDYSNVKKAEVCYINKMSGLILQSKATYYPILVLIYPQDPKYSVSHTTWHFNTLINKSRVKK